MQVSAIINSRRLAGGLGALLLACAPGWLAARETNALRFGEIAQARYVAAQTRFEAEPTNAVAVGKFARACFFRADYATNNTERASLAVQGIAACRSWLEREPKSAAAHYYLGINLGQLARTRMISALAIVAEMEDQFKAARRLDEHLDFAGPDRTLGLLYLRAPTIGSVGSRSKARRHLFRAAEVAPNYPDNQLNLTEVLLGWKEPAAAAKRLPALEAALAHARPRLTGDEWAADWADWNQRAAIVRQQLRPK